MKNREPEQKPGTCEWCGADGEIWNDNKACESCDNDICWCSICKRHEHWESKCRHVFQDQNFEWRGAGVRPVDDDMKKPFFTLLKQMPAGFAVELRKAIRSGRFYTWFCAPLIGGGAIFTLYGIKNRHEEYADAMGSLGEGEHAEEAADGYHWLASLYEKKTLKANRATVKWINEWLAQIPPAAT